jgi:Adenylate and Guanylate cyclase catalytic domain
VGDLPAGTVTLVFTDIEGSTRLLERLGERYEQALADHRELLRAAFASHGGVEVDTQGDAFFFSFSRAKDAVLAAAEGQQALTEHPWPNDDALRVRMGIHTGEPTRTAEGYVGADVHRAARICSAGHGAQVLVSQTTRDLVDDVPLEDLGEPQRVNRAQLAVCQALVAEGDVDAAEPLAAEALELTQEQEDVRGEHLAHHFLADCALIRADCEEAETRYARSLEAAWRMGDRLEASIELQGMGMAAGCGRRRERAVRLAAAGLAFQKSVGADYSGIVFWQTLIDKYIGGAQSELGTEAAASAWEEGRALGLERAVEYALDLSSD